MRAFVTGGAGFVGSAVVRALLAAGVEVSCLVRPTSVRTNLDGLDIDIVQGDLTDVATFARALRECQHLYHVAAHYSTLPQDAEAMYATNVGGTQQVLYAALDAGVERIVHTSTIGTIGRPHEGSLPTEVDRLTNLSSASPYARSKLEAEAFCLSLADKGAPVVVVNPCAPVGLGDLKPSSTGARIIAYLKGRRPSFLAGGINFISVEDVAAGHLLAAEHGRIGQRYILGHAEGNLMLADFFRMMESVSGVRSPSEQSHVLYRAKGLARRAFRLIKRAGARDTAGQERHAVGPAAQPDYRPQALTADPSLAIRELGLPQTPLETAFREAIEWFRAHGYC